MGSGAQSQSLALVFTTYNVMALLWQKLDGRIRILSQSQPVEVNPGPANTLNEAIDNALGQLGESALSVKQVLFGLPASWVENQQIRPDRKTFLQNLSKDLVLEPLGFVTNSDGLVASYLDQQGKTFTGAVIDEDADSLVADLYQDGHWLKQEIVGKSDDRSTDWSEALARVNKTLAKAPVMVIPSLDEPLANFLAKNLGDRYLPQTFSLLAPIITEQGAREMLAKTTVEESTPPTVAKSDAPLMNPPPPGNEFHTPSFLVNNAADIDQAPASSEADSEPLTAEPAPNANPRQPRLKFSFPKLALHLPHWKGSATTKKPLLLLLLVIMIGVGLLSVYWWLSRSYTVRVEAFLSPHQYEQTATIPLVISTASAATTSGLPATLVKETVVITKEVPTTGTKLIGDKAKGTVTIFNKTTQSKTFGAGTKLSVGKLSFTLDSEVTVASASSQEGSSSLVITFGTTDAKVTANAIGTDSNIAKDLELAIANFAASSYTAKSKEGFSGGSSREIQAVAARDIETAARGVTEEATSQLQQKIEALSDNDSKVLFLPPVQITEQLPTPALGSESQQVSVAITIEGEGVRLTNQAIQEHLKSILAGSLQPNEEWNSDSLQLTPTANIERRGDLINLEANLRGTAIPKLDTSELKNQLRGQFLVRAQSQLEEHPSLEQISIRYSPSWSEFLFRRLPKDTERLQFNLRFTQP